MTVNRRSKAHHDSKKPIRLTYLSVHTKGRRLEAVFFEISLIILHRFTGRIRHFLLLAA